MDTNKTNPAHVNADMYFYGTFMGADIYMQAEDWTFYQFDFRVDTVLVGYKEYLWDGLTVTLQSPFGPGVGVNRWTQNYRIGSPYGIEQLDGNELVEPYADLTSVYEELEVGSRYLLHGVYEEACSSRNHLFFPYRTVTDELEDETIFTICPLTEDLWY